MAEIEPPGPQGKFTKDQKKKFLLWVVLFAAVVVATYYITKPWSASYSVARYSFMSGDPVRGGGLFGGLGCNACHSLYGIGPKIGPDLAGAPTRSWSPVRTVAEMWSHSPEMWQKMKDAQLGFPRITEQNMVDLLSYLYLIRYVDQPGDAEQGRKLFSSKHCADCHSIGGGPNRVGPDLSSLSVDTPIMWAQQMWNHGQGMEKLTEQKNIAWPQFQGNEMIDLLAYLQQSSSGRRREANLFPADPVRGKELFKEKGCQSCHALNGEGGGIGPDLGASHSSAPTITQFAGLMWNHSPQMLAKMQTQAIARPQFGGREMADLIAYLYVMRYMEPAGDAGAGKVVFQAKHCSDCHSDNGHGGHGGPNLAGHGSVYHAPQMASIVWTHGPQMYRKMQEKNLPWPTLSEKDLTDLMSFLNSL